MERMIGSQVDISELYKRIKEERKRRDDAHKREIQARGLGDQHSTAAQHTLNLYADGDSWFEYPLSKEVIGWLEADFGDRALINNQAHHGDTAIERIGLAKRQRLIANLNDPAHGHYDGILFSAGGNDLAGDQFVLWLKQSSGNNDPASAVYQNRLNSALAIIIAAYTDLIEIRDSWDRNCKIFLHGYDFAYPSGVPACLHVGPWLQPSLRFKGWNDIHVGWEIVKYILSEFDRALSELERNHHNVIYVRTQGTLHINEWANELHPTSEGFRKIAGKFYQAILNQYPQKMAGLPPSQFKSPSH